MNFQEGEILYVKKPYQWTSFALVNKVRWKITQTLKHKIKVGHAGTLDPLATGVMILCTGKATKRIEEFQYQTKEYIATLKLGETTPSYDLEHAVNEIFPIEHITKELVEKVIPTFQGEIWQIPPVYSAVKVDGKRAYDYARSGEDVELKPKLLVIDKIEILNFSLPELKIRVVCSKGTYIRALARDIGEALGSGAHLTALERTRIGEVKLEDCWEVDDLLKHIEKESVV
ncbi:tRNA pseudouridine synthase B [uncultured Paludibacter sp.]|uniref:tRNA pseudouridine synthase B n=1 Tax=uncultured Paludibacter sp. TaxID=497635 RepID=A0A653AAV7_9BACT|nr:tRNA pseudouridine synthase B [uncultured Paludibacter sp.]